MRIITLLFIMAVSNPLLASSRDSNKQEMQEMKQIHAQCMNSEKSSGNCHQDMMKACDAGQEECLTMMERMNMKDVIRAKGENKSRN